MPDFGLKFIPKDVFFDRKKVIDRVGIGKAKALSRVGAYVRTTAQRSMRPAGKKGATASEGEAPRVHEGSLKRLIFFGLGSSGSVVDIGPVVFRQGEAPALNEFGGEVTRVINGKRVEMKYEPHPFMGPALEVEIDKGTIPAAFENSVNGD